MTVLFSSVRRLAFAGVLTLLIGGTAAAQATSTSSGLHATRAELQQMVAARDGRSAAELEAIRNRLEEGDFQTGDQVTITVVTHPDLSGTYTVEPDRTIVLPNIGPVSLRGVLRSELEPHLNQYLSRFVREPRVRARSTIRLMVMGGVGRPGFYSVPSHALITEVIDSAGGTGRDSRLTSIRVERDGRRVIDGQPMQDAIIAGRTLDQLNIRAGDRIIVPERRDLARNMQLLWVVTGLISAVYTVTRIF